MIMSSKDLLENVEKALEEIRPFLQMMVEISI